MKISDLLKSLLSDPSQGASLLGDKGIVAPKNNQGGGESFDQVLTRLASQAPTAGSGASQHGVEAAGNSKTPSQARQVLDDLTTAVTQLTGVLSKLQQGQAGQAQAILQTLGGGTLTPGDMQKILNDLQASLQKLSASQNPLNLPPGEQAQLLAQALQQMVAQGQIQLSGGGNQPTSNNATAPAVGAAQTQTTQVSINLPNFKMTASFIQEGTGGTSGAVAPNPAPSIPLNPPVATAPAVGNGTVGQPQGGAVVNQAATGNDLGQNFKNLVQLLMQSGVGQAALTTIIRHSQETPAAGNAAQVAASQTAPPLQPVGPIAAPPVEATLGASDNADAARTPSRSAQSPENQPTPTPMNPLTAPAKEAAANPPVREMAGPTKAATSVTTGQGQPALEKAPGVGLESAANVVIPKPAVNAAPVPPVAAAETASTQNQTPHLGGQNQPAANPALAENSALNPQEVAALNDVVTRLNTAALHLIQGSIGGAGSILTPDSRITMGQVLSGLSATRLSSAQPPTFGNPSVPMNAPLPPQPSLAVENNIKALKVSALTPSLQPAAPNSAAPAPRAPQPIVFSGPAITLSTALEEPINQTAPPAGNTPLVAPVSFNNGVTAAALGATTNPVTSTPAAVAPPTTTNVVAGPAPAQAPTTIVALPQPGTLPVPTGANPPGASPANAPGTVQAFAPASLNLNVVPPPTSSAPNVPATTSMGEAVKIEAPPAAVVRNENLNFQSPAAAAQPASSLIPIAPEAVAPAGTLLSSAADLASFNVTDKNGPNHSSVLEGNTLLNLSNTANIIPNTTHLTTPASVATPAPGGNFDTVSLLSQISQQVAAQAAEARTVSRLNFQLIPESLGRVTVQLALVDQSVTARIVVASPEVRDTLQSHMVDLKSALNQAGLQIDQLQVQVQGGGANLLAQYYQYQQEGFAYRLPASPIPAGEGAENQVNSGILAPSVARGLVDVLA